MGLNSKVHWLSLPLTTLALSLTMGVASAQDGAGALQLWSSEADATPPLVEAAEEMLGVDIEVTSVPYVDLQGQFAQAVSANKSPDLVFSSCGLQQTWGAQNLLAPVDLGDATADIDPAALLAGNWDGQTVCVPATVQSVALHRNRTLVPEPQLTWDQVQKTCADWPDDGTYCIAFTDRDDFDVFHVFPIITAYGGYLFDYQDGKWDTSAVGVDDPGTREAFKMISGLVKSGKAVATTADQISNLFISGKLGLWITGSWETVKMPKEGLDFVVEAAPSGPAGKGRPFVNSFGMYVSGSAPNLALAQLFVKNYWATAEGMELVQETLEAPTSWIPLQQSDPNFKGFIEASQGGEPIPQVDIMGQAWPLWSAPLKRAFVDGPDSVDESTAAAHKAIVALSQN